MDTWNPDLEKTVVIPAGLPLLQCLHCLKGLPDEHAVLEVEKRAFLFCTMVCACKWRKTVPAKARSFLKIARLSK